MVHARISGHDVRVGNELGIFERIARISSTSTAKDYQGCLMPAGSVKLSELEQRVRSEGAHSKVSWPTHITTIRMDNRRYR